MDIGQWIINWYEHLFGGEKTFQRWYECQVECEAGRVKVFHNNKLVLTGKCDKRTCDCG